MDRRKFTKLILGTPLLLAPQQNLPVIGEGLTRGAGRRSDGSKKEKCRYIPNPIMRNVSTRHNH